MNRWAARLASAVLGSLAWPVAHADFDQAFRQYQAGHYEGARAEFLMLAELGDNASQFNLGAMALQGQGGPKDPGAAVGWLIAAAENGSQRVAAEKLTQMRSALTEEQRRTADGILGRYGRMALLKTALPVPRADAHCEDVAPAHMLENAQGKYPLRDRLAGRSALVVLQLTVGADGHGRDPQVLVSEPEAAEFAAAAVEMLIQGAYAPARRGARRVESTIPLRIVFNTYPQGTPHAFDAQQLNSVEKGARKGDPRSLYRIGIAAILDRTLGISPAKAHDLLVSAAQGGNAQAQYWVASRFMALGSCEQEQKKIPWLRAAAAAGDGAAQLALASDLIKAEPSAQQVAEARSLLEEAAKSDDYYVRKHVTALMAASPLDAIRDPARAAQLAHLLLRDAIQTDPHMFEAIAAAGAVNGDFRAAVESQETAITKAAGLHWNTRLMQERLEAYRDSRAWFGDLFAIPPAENRPPGPGAEVARRDPKTAPAQPES